MSITRRLYCPEHFVTAPSLANVTGVLHSCIIKGIRGDGGHDFTWMMIIDPAGGRRYQESIARFQHKYENAIVRIGAGQYYQIRHF